jgi:hypothetical protein
VKPTAGNCKAVRGGVEEETATETDREIKRERGQDSMVLTRWLRERPPFYWMGV